MRVTQPNPRQGHEVEAIFGLLAPLGIAPPPGSLVLEPIPDKQTKTCGRLCQQKWFRDRLTLAAHISARKRS